MRSLPQNFTSQRQKQRGAKNKYFIGCKVSLFSLHCFMLLPLPCRLGQFPHWFLSIEISYYFDIYTYFSNYFLIVFISHTIYRISAYDYRCELLRVSFAFELFIWSTYVISWPKTQKLSFHFASYAAFHEIERLIRLDFRYLFNKNEITPLKFPPALIFHHYRLYY